jgi:hypothetical protein
MKPDKLTKQDKGKKHRHRYDRCKAKNCVGGTVANHLGPQVYCKCGKRKP